MLFTIKDISLYYKYVHTYIYTDWTFYAVIQKQNSAKKRRVEQSVIDISLNAFKLF